MTLMRMALAAAVSTRLLGGEPIALPPPERVQVFLSDALMARRTDRVLVTPSLSLQEASQLLWAAQGENRPGRRTAPSIYAKYSLEVYLVTVGSPTLPEGVYHYRSAGHQLEKLAEGGPKQVLGRVKGMFSLISNAPAVIAIAGDYSRIESAAFGKGVQYSWYEAGAASENLLLMAAALKLGAATQTPYSVDMDEVAKSMGIARPVRPFSLVLLGRVGAQPAN